jgi:hypothetical protein
MKIKKATIIREVATVSLKMYTVEQEDLAESAMNKRNFFLKGMVDETPFQ